MKNILINAFNNCTSLTSIYMEGEAPKLSNMDAFGYSSNPPYTNAGFKIYVKETYLSTYQQENPMGSNWYYYQDKIETYK